MELKTKNKKSIKIPLLLLIAVVLFSFSVNAANAANISTNNSTIYVNNQGNDTWDGQSATYNGTSGPKQTITNAISTVANDGTIYLASGTYYESNIQITSNMTIIGDNQQNTVIDAQEQGNIFYINDGISLTLVNLTLQNSANCAIWNEFGVLNITNVTFNNNIATTNFGGGAIYNSGTLTETNDTFNNNTAEEGLPPSYFGGGAIYNSGILTETNDTFNNNTATTIYGGYGGAIFNSGTLTETNDTFNNNTAPTMDGNFDGYGGAIFNLGTLTETNDIFINNYETVIDGEGGAICNWGTLTENNNTFTNNSAIDGGAGAIYNDGVLTETNDTFTNNSAIDGGAIYNDGVLTETNDTFHDNIATDGGAIYNSNGNLTENNNTFNNNIATDGGAIYNQYNLTDIDVTFNNNTANTGNGGAIYNSGTLNDTYDTYNNNTATDDSGSIYNDGALTFTNDSFYNNSPDLDNIYPTVYITNPLNGTYVHGVVPINVISTDTIGVTNVIFTINGNSYTDTNGTDIWSYNWNTSGLSDGIYNITISTYDAANNCQIQIISVNVENTLPTVITNTTAGLYNTTKVVKLTLNESGTIYYYTTNGTAPTNTSNIYTSPISISSNTTLNYFAIDLAGKMSPIYTQTYTIDKTIPISNVNVKGGLYNTNKVVTLTMSEAGKIYYTINGTTPTTSSTLYTGSITISKTTVLKYLALDLAGNKSPVYTQTYTINKIPPKITSTIPTNNAQKVSLTTNIIIKFTENITAATNYSKIYIKDLTTGKTVLITKTISGSTLTIKTSKRSTNNIYEVVIPSASIKDQASNNLAATYTFKFRTV